MNYAVKNIPEIHLKEFLAEQASLIRNRKLLAELNSFKYEDFADDIFIITIGIKD